MKKKMSEIKKKENNWWSYILFQFLWLIVIMPKEIQFVMLAGISCILIWKGKKHSPDLVVGCVLAYAGCHILSILYNAITGEYSIVRILAACNTALIWIVAAGIYHYYRWNSVNYQKLAKAGFANGGCMAGLSVIFLIVRNFTDGFAVPIINCVLLAREKDIFIDRIRFWGFQGYPTLIVAFELLMFPFAFWYVWTKLPKKIRVAGVTILTCGVLLPIYFSYSRSGYVLIGVEVLIFALLLFSEKLNKKQRYGLYIILVVVGICVILVGHGLIIKIYHALVNMRAGSNGTRVVIYEETWKCFLRHPILGCGIKELSSTGYPLGSHCSYLGFLYKTGIIGTAFMFIALGKNAVHMIQNIVQNDNLLASLCSVAIGLLYLFFLFEDVDGADWLVCMWMALSGILSAYKTTWKY